MKHFDKMRDKLRSENVLPEGMDWDSMAEGIAKKEAALAKDNFEPNGYSWWRIFLMVGLLSLIGISYFIWEDKSKTTVSPELSDQLAPISSNNKNLGVDIGTNTDIDSKSKLNVNAIGDVENTVHREDLQINENVPERDAFGKNENGNENLKSGLEKVISKDILSGNGIRSSISQNLFDSNAQRDLTVEAKVLPKVDLDEGDGQGKTGQVDLNKNQKTVVAWTRNGGIKTGIDAKDNTGKGSSIAKGNNRVEAFKEEAVSLDRSIQFLPNKELGVLGSFVLKLPKQSYGFGQYRATPRSLLLSAHAGANFWYSDHFNTANEEVTERSLIGYQVGLRLDYPLNDKFYISAGINYNRLLSRLDAKLVQDSLVESNELVEITHDVFSGNIIEVYGDTLVNQTTTRTIRHFNEWSYWSIPVLFGYKTKKGAFDLYAGAGISMDFARKAVGRSIRDWEVADYNQVKQTFGISLQADLGLRYHLNNKMFIGSRFSYSHVLSPWEIGIGQPVAPRVFNASFSVGMKF